MTPPPSKIGCHKFPTWGAVSGLYPPTFTPLPRPFFGHFLTTPRNCAIFEQNGRIRPVFDHFRGQTTPNPPGDAVHVGPKAGQGMHGHHTVQIPAQPPEPPQMNRHRLCHQMSALCRRALLPNPPSSRAVFLEWHRWQSPCQFPEFQNNDCASAMRSESPLSRASDNRCGTMWSTSRAATGLSSVEQAAHSGWRARNVSRALRHRPPYPRLAALPRCLSRSRPCSTWTGRCPSQ